MSDDEARMPPAIGRVGSLADLVEPRAERARPGDFPEEPFVGLDSIEPHTMRLLGTVTAGSMKSSAVRFRPGQVLYGRLRPYLNKVFAPDFEGLASAEFICLQPRGEHVAKFIQYRLNCMDFVRAASRANEGDRPRVDFSQISAFPVCIPSSTEQARIVEALESYLSRLEAVGVGLERVQRNLKRLRSSVLQAAISGRLVPTEAELASSDGRDFESGSDLLGRILAERRRRWEESGERGKYKAPGPVRTQDLKPLPGGWAWVTVETVGDVLLGRRRAPEYVGRPRPYLRVANVRDDRIDMRVVKEMLFSDSEAALYRLEPGDILVSEGQSVERIGQSAIFRGDHEHLCFQSTLHRFRRFDSAPSSAFCQLVFRAHVRSGVFQRHASITTNIAHLVLRSFRAVPFPLPPLAEQARIVEAASRALSVIDAIEVETGRFAARSSRLRQAVLKSGFDGELVDRLNVSQLEPRS